MHKENIPMEGYTITFNNALTPSLSHKPVEFSGEFLNHVRERTFAGEPDAEEVLTKLIQGYPHFPLPHFFLAYLYLKLEQYDQAKKRIDEMGRLFPSYFWTVYLQAFWCVHEGKYELIPQILGSELDIHKTFPHISFFHLEEFMLYQSLVGTYYLKTKQFEKAEKHIEFLKEIDKKHSEVERLISSLKVEKLGASISETLEELEQSQRYLDPNYKSPVETVRYEHPKTGRNDPCPCGSGKKYKKCCLK